VPREFSIKAPLLRQVGGIPSGWSATLKVSEPPKISDRPQLHRDCCGHLDKCRLEMTGVRKADTTPKVGVKECNRLLTTVIVELVGNSA
jgi:hypothetical protein